jgi:hypothetical protein
MAVGSGDVIKTFELHLYVPPRNKMNSVFVIALKTTASVYMTEAREQNATGSGSKGP